MDPAPGLKISITDFSAEGMFVNGWGAHIVLKLIVLLFLTQVQVIP